NSRREFGRGKADDTKSAQHNQDSGYRPNNALTNRDAGDEIKAMERSQHSSEDAEREADCDIDSEECNGDARGRHCGCRKVHEPRRQPCRVAGYDQSEQPKNHSAGERGGYHASGVLVVLAHEVASHEAGDRASQAEVEQSHVGCEGADNDPDAVLFASEPRYEERSEEEPDEQAGRHGGPVAKHPAYDSTKARHNVSSDARAPVGVWACSAVSFCFQQWEVSSGHRSRAVPDRGEPPYSQFGGRFGDTASCTPIARRTMPVMSVTGGPCSRRAATWRVHCRHSAASVRRSAKSTWHQRRRARVRLARTRQSDDGTPAHVSALGGDAGHDRVRLLCPVPGQV